MSIECMLCSSEFNPLTVNQRLCVNCIPKMQRELAANPHKHDAAMFGDLYFDEEDED